MTHTGYKYKVVESGIGCLIVRLSDGADCWLQGDDANDIRQSLDNLDAIKYPSGPFADYQSHLDVVLDQYDEILTGAK